jgi:hypothetical protein
MCPMCTKSLSFDKNCRGGVEDKTKVCGGNSLIDPIILSPLPIQNIIHKLIQSWGRLPPSPRPTLGSSSAQHRDVPVSTGGYNMHA